MLNLLSLSTTSGVQEFSGESWAIASGQHDHSSLPRTVCLPCDKYILKWFTNPRGLAVKEEKHKPVGP
jgi:hypothetical protein